MMRRSCKVISVQPFRLRLLGKRSGEPKLPAMGTGTKSFDECTLPVKRNSSSRSCAATAPTSSFSRSFSAYPSSARLAQIFWSSRGRGDGFSRRTTLRSTATRRIWTTGISAHGSRGLNTRLSEFGTRTSPGHTIFSIHCGGSPELSGNLRPVAHRGAKLSDAYNVRPISRRVACREPKKPILAGNRQIDQEAPTVTGSRLTNQPEKPDTPEHRNRVTRLMAKYVQRAACER